MARQPAVYYLRRWFFHLLRRGLLYHRPLPRPQRDFHIACACHLRSQA